LSNTSELNFVRQQGFRDASPADSEVLYPALMWQPRVGALVILAGIVWQAWPVFAAMSALLWWNAILPKSNPFSVIYNRFLAGRLGRPAVPPAPAPRRFAQGMAGTFCLGAGVCLLLGWSTAAHVFEAILVAALTSLILGGFCLGSYIFHWLRRDGEFANRTLPWSPAEPGAPGSAEAKAAR
jgi:hypothetical protein